MSGGGHLFPLVGEAALFARRFEPPALVVALEAQPRRRGTLRRELLGGGVLDAGGRLRARARGACTRGSKQTGGEQTRDSGDVVCHDPRMSKTLATCDDVASAHVFVPARRGDA